MENIVKVEIEDYLPEVTVADVYLDIDGAVEEADNYAASLETEDVKPDLTHLKIKQERISPVPWKFGDNTNLTDVRRNFSCDADQDIKYDPTTKKISEQTNHSDEEIDIDTPYCEKLKGQTGSKLLSAASQPSLSLGLLNHSDLTSLFGSRLARQKKPSCLFLDRNETPEASRISQKEQSCQKRGVARKSTTARGVKKTASNVAKKSTSQQSKPVRKSNYTAALNVMRKPAAKQSKCTAKEPDDNTVPDVSKTLPVKHTSSNAGKPHKHSSLNVAKKSTSKPAQSSLIVSNLHSENSRKEGVNPLTHSHFEPHDPASAPNAEHHTNEPEVGSELGRGLDSSTTPVPCPDQVSGFEKSQIDLTHPTPSQNVSPEPKTVFIFVEKSSKEIACPQCFVKIIQCSLKDHLKTVHDLQLKACAKCKIGFTDVNQYSEHYAFHLQQEENHIAGILRSPLNGGFTRQRLTRKQRRQLVINRKQAEVGVEASSQNLDDTSSEANGQKDSVMAGPKQPSQHGKIISPVKRSERLKMRPSYSFASLFTRNSFLHGKDPKAKVFPETYGTGFTSRRAELGSRSFCSSSKRQNLDIETTQDSQVRTCAKCKMQFTDVNQYSEHYAFHLQQEENRKAGKNKTAFKKGFVHQQLARKRMGFKAKKHKSAALGQGIVASCEAHMPEASPSSDWDAPWSPPQSEESSCVGESETGYTSDTLLNEEETADFQRGQRSRPPLSSNMHCPPSKRQRLDDCAADSYTVPDTNCAEVSVSIVSLEAAAHPFNCKKCLQAFHLALVCPGSFRQYFHDRLSAIKPAEGSPLQSIPPSVQQDTPYSVDSDEDADEEGEAREENENDEAGPVAPVNVSVRQETTARQETPTRQTPVTQETPMRHETLTSQETPTRQESPVRQGTPTRQEIPMRQGTTQNSKTDSPEKDGAEKSGSFECNVCHKHFQYHSDLLKHTPYHSYQFACGFCRKAYQQKGDLFDHFEIVHGGRMRFRCKYCERRFADLVHFHTHMKTHKDGTVVRCTVCNKKYSSTQQMLLHMKKCHGPCEVCGKKFLDEKLFVKHLRTAHGKRTEKQVVPKHLSCRMCARVFQTLPGLLSHKRHHHRRVLSTTLSTWRAGKTQSDVSTSQPAIASPKEVDPSASTRRETRSSVQPQPSVPSPKLSVSPNRIKPPLSQPNEIIPNRLRSETKSYRCASEGGSLRCKVCHKLLHSLIGLKRHYSHAHNGVSLPKYLRAVKIGSVHSCPKCDKHFFHTTSVSRHIHLAHGNASVGGKKVTNKEMSGAQKCRNCGKNFGSKLGKTFLAHTKLCHAKQSRRQASEEAQPLGKKCLLCEKSFLWRKSLVRHMLIIHQVSKKELPSNMTGVKSVKQENGGKITPLYLCKICKECFTVKKSFKLHQVNRHNGKSGFFQCRFCRQSCTRNSSLFLHIRRRHEGRPPFLCRGCNQEFYTSETIYKHRCGSDSSTDCREESVESKQETPLSKVKTEEPEYRYRCAACNIGFYIAHEWTKHMQEHFDSIHKDSDSKEEGQNAPLCEENAENCDAKRNDSHSWQNNGGDECIDLDSWDTSEVQIAGSPLPAGCEEETPLPVDNDLSGRDDTARGTSKSLDSVEILQESEETSPSVELQNKQKSVADGQKSDRVKSNESYKNCPNSQVIVQGELSLGAFEDRYANALISEYLADADTSPTQAERSVQEKEVTVENPSKSKAENTSPTVCLPSLENGNRMVTEDVVDDRLQCTVERSSQKEHSLSTETATQNVATSDEKQSQQTSVIQEHTAGRLVADDEHASEICKTTLQISKTQKTDDEDMSREESKVAQETEAATTAGMVHQNAELVQQDRACSTTGKARSTSLDSMSVEKVFTCHLCKKGFADQYSSIRHKCDTSDCSHASVTLERQSSDLTETSNEKSWNLPEKIDNLNSTNCEKDESLAGSSNRQEDESSSKSSKEEDDEQSDESSKRQGKDSSGEIRKRQKDELFSANSKRRGDESVDENKGHEHEPGGESGKKQENTALEESGESQEDASCHKDPAGENPSDGSVQSSGQAAITGSIDSPTPAMKCSSDPHQSQTRNRNDEMEQNRSLEKEVRNTGNSAFFLKNEIKQFRGFTTGSQEKKNNKNLVNNSMQKCVAVLRKKLGAKHAKRHTEQLGKGEQKACSSERAAAGDGKEAGTKQESGRQNIFDIISSKSALNHVWEKIGKDEDLFSQKPNNVPEEQSDTQASSKEPGKTVELKKKATQPHTPPHSSGDQTVGTSKKPCGSLNNTSSKLHDQHSAGEMNIVGGETADCVSQIHVDKDSGQIVDTGDSPLLQPVVDHAEEHTSSGLNVISQEESNCKEREQDDRTCHDTNSVSQSYDSGDKHESANCMDVILSEECETHSGERVQNCVADSEPKLTVDETLSSEKERGSTQSPVICESRAVEKTPTENPDQNGNLATAERCRDPSPSDNTRTVVTKSDQRLNIFDMLSVGSNSCSVCQNPYTDQHLHLECHRTSAKQTTSLSSSGVEQRASREGSPEEATIVLDKSDHNAKLPDATGRRNNGELDETSIASRRSNDLSDYMPVGLYIRKHCAEPQDQEHTEDTTVNKPVLHDLPHPPTGVPDKSPCIVDQQKESILNKTRNSLSTHIETFVKKYAELKNGMAFRVRPQQGIHFDSVEGIDRDIVTDKGEIHAQPATAEQNQSMDKDTQVRNELLDTVNSKEPIGVVVLEREARCIPVLKNVQKLMSRLRRKSSLRQGKKLRGNDKESEHNVKEEKHTLETQVRKLRERKHANKKQVQARKSVHRRKSTKDGDKCEKQDGRSNIFDILSGETASTSQASIKELGDKDSKGLHDSGTLPLNQIHSHSPLISQEGTSDLVEVNKEATVSAKQTNSSDNSFLHVLPGTVTDCNQSMEDVHTPFAPTQAASVHDSPAETELRKQLTELLLNSHVNSQQSSGSEYQSDSSVSLPVSRYDRPKEPSHVPGKNHSVPDRNNTDQIRGPFEILEQFMVTDVSVSQPQHKLNLQIDTDSLKSVEAETSEQKDSTSSRSDGQLEKGTENQNIRTRSARKYLENLREKIAFDKAQCSKREAKRDHAVRGSKRQCLRSSRNENLSHSSQEHQTTPVQTRKTSSSDSGREGEAASVSATDRRQNIFDVLSGNSFI